MRRDSIGEVVLLFFEQNNRPPVRYENSLFLLRHSAEFPDRLNVRGHKGKGLVAPPFFGAQPPDRFLIRSVARDMESAQSLDGNNLSLF